jgi:tRNA-splicing ligase RtcB
MTIAAERPVIAVDCVCGRAVRSVVATNEPERHRARALADLAAALPPLDRFDRLDCRIERVVTTPDFHPGKPVPVGVVVDMVGGMMPHLIGNDIGCGMRMIVLHDVDEADLTPGLDGHLRHVHFQGGRGIALTGHDRRAALREGIPGLLESLGASRKGLLATLDMASAWRDVDRTADDGFFATEAVDPDFAAFIDGGSAYRHDAIFGTIGGGNHFVEFGVVESIADGQFAAVAGLRRGTMVLVVHSGSLDFGQRVGSSIRQALNSPGRRGDARILDSRCMPQLAARYANGLANAANAAFVNRLLIGLSAIEALQRTLGRSVGHHLVYDAPHNTIWREGETFRHRKGACPARGPGQLVGSPYQWLGEPVILPGSMGDGTWLLRGLGDADGLQSAAHGAGRRLSQQEARGQARAPSTLRVVGPVDLSSAALKSRPDIRREVEGRLTEEAPDAYKPIENVVTPMVDAGLVGRVAKIRPVLTVKG